MQSRMGIGGASSKGYPLDCMGYFVNPMHRRSPEVEGSPAFKNAPLLAVDKINYLAQAQREVQIGLTLYGSALSGGLRSSNYSSKEL